MIMYDRMLTKIPAGGMRFKIGLNKFLFDLNSETHILSPLIDYVSRQEITMYRILLAIIAVTVFFSQSFADEKPGAKFQERKPT